MSAKLGAVKYGTGDAEPFMGRDYGHQRDYSEEIAGDIDAEIRELIEGAHDEAWEILVQYRDVLDSMVLELVEKETLAKDDLERILAPVRKRPPHNTFAGFGKRTPSDRPPIEIPVQLRKRPQPVNGSNGAHADQPVNGGSAGGGEPVRPGAQPQPGYPAPQPEHQPGAFGPTTQSGSPYGGYPPPPPTAPQAGGAPPPPPSAPYGQ
jgi:cell division protease FtsH